MYMCVHVCTLSYACQNVHTEDVRCCFFKLTGAGIGIGPLSLAYLSTVSVDKKKDLHQLLVLFRYKKKTNHKVVL